MTLCFSGEITPAALFKGESVFCLHGCDWKAPVSRGSKTHYTRARLGFHLHRASGDAAETDRISDRSVKGGSSLKNQLPFGPSRPQTFICASWHAKPLHQQAWVENVSGMRSTMSCTMDPAIPMEDQQVCIYGYISIYFWNSSLIVKCYSYMNFISILLDICFIFWLTLHVLHIYTIDLSNVSI